MSKRQITANKLNKNYLLRLIIAWSFMTGYTSYGKKEIKEMGVELFYRFMYRKER